MTIEEFVIAYLSRLMDVPVSGDVPTPLPQRFLTVEKTGGGESGKLKHATLAVQCWAESRAAAGLLCELATEKMLEMEGEAEISQCSLDASYNYTDITRRKPRYQAVFDIVHYL